MIKLATLLAIALAGLSAVTKASYLTVEQVIQIFDYSDIKASDKTGEVAANYGESILYAMLFEPSDEGFSRIQFLVTKGGFLLNDSLRQKLESNPDEIRHLTLSNEAVAYVGLEGAGPGGEGYIAIAHLDNPDVDLQLKLIISNDGTSQSSPDIESFRSKLRDPETLKMALQKILDGAAVNIINQGLRPTAPPISKNEPATVVESEPVPPPAVVEQEEKQPSEVPFFVKEKPDVSPCHYWWLAGLSLAAALIIWRITRRK